MIILLLDVQYISYILQQCMSPISISKYLNGEFPAHAMVFQKRHPWIIFFFHPFEFFRNGFWIFFTFLNQISNFDLSQVLLRLPLQALFLIKHLKYDICLLFCNFFYEIKYYATCSKHTKNENDCISFLLTLFYIWFMIDLIF